MKDNKIKIIIAITLIAGVCVAGFIGVKVNERIDTLNEALNDANNRYEKLEDSYIDLKEDIEAKEELQTENISKIEEELKRKEEEKLKKEEDEKKKREEEQKAIDDMQSASSIAVPIEEAPMTENQISIEPLPLEEIRIAD